MVPATITTGWSRTLLAAATAMALAPSFAPAVAQTVLGRVLERGGGGPVAGAMLRLETVVGSTGVGWLTAADGRFRLQAPAGGTYAIRVERIGFAATVVRDVTVAADGIASIDVVVETQPIALEGLEVAARGGRCRVEGGGGSAQLLWDEARKALAAASWTESRGELRFVVSVWDRQISPRTSQILFEETSQHDVVGANSVQSLPPDQLLADGYVQTRGPYSYYYAPDAEALLSDEFQNTHCFRVVEGERGSPYLGLEFKPNDERRLPDVAGVIWLDRVSARLDRVEFRYTGLDVPGASRARGEVRFADLESGQWIVRDWFIHAPMPASPIGTPGRLRRDAAALQIHDVGSTVELVEGQGILWRPDIAPGGVRGTVFDSIAGAPLAGASVRVAGGNLRALVDLDGRFELRGVRPGMHRLTFGHERLDSLGVTAGWRTVEVEPGGVVEVELAVPSWLSLLARSCGDEGAGALVGYVYSRSGARVGGATVEAHVASGVPGEPRTAASDGEGGYVLCGVPAGVTRVAARLGTTESEAIEIRVDSTRYALADLTLRPEVVAAAVQGALRPALVGTVVVRGSRRPLEGVAVGLLGPDGETVASTITDGQGRFSAVLDEGGEVFLSVSRLGYTGAVSEAITLIEGTRRIEVILPEEAIEIDPVIVLVDSRLPQLERVGFYERSVTHPGAFIQQDDVAAISPARTSDLLGRVPGVRVTTDSSGSVPRRRVLFNRLALIEGDLCYPALFVDDQLARIGGSRTESQWPAIQGVEPPPGEDVPSIDELVPPHEILAVEMYENAARLPSRFIGLGTHCGVIVIWTTRAR
jgi:hypothetical protein